MGLSYWYTLDISKQSWNTKLSNDYGGNNFPSLEISKWVRWICRIGKFPSSMLRREKVKRIFSWGNTEPFMKYIAKMQVSARF